MQVRTGLGTGHSVTAVRPAGKRWAVTAGATEESAAGACPALFGRLAEDEVDWERPSKQV